MARVLVVDPDQALSQWLAQTLSAHGFHAAVAFDAASGQAMAANLQPDLLVVDQHLGGVGAVAFVRAARDAAGGRPVGALVMAPDGNLSQLRDRFMGLDDFVRKPLCLPEVIERLHRMYHRMVNLPEVVAELGRYAARLRTVTSARRMRLTVMFADVRGFTGMSETRDPETVAAAINNLLEHLAASVIRFGGVIDKFLGDGMMVVFGTDEHSADHELAACYAAQEIMDTLPEADSASLFTGVDLALGIGMNTGDAVVGPVGPQFRRELTVLGDTVNIAARVCGDARPGEMLVTESTYREVVDRVVLLEMRDGYLKGKRHPLRLYSVRLA